MIVYEGPGNLFTCGVQTIVCSINTMGAMGKGIALTFKQSVPGLYDYYRARYHDQPPHYPSIHRLEVYEVDARRKVLLFPTKDNWRYPSKIEMIRTNLAQLAANYEDLGITSLGLPLIGCGFETGRLDWADSVRPLVYEYLDPIPLSVKILTG